MGNKFHSNPDEREMNSFQGDILKIGMVLRYYQIDFFDIVSLELRLNSLRAFISRKVIIGTKFRIYSRYCVKKCFFQYLIFTNSYDQHHLLCQ